MFKKVPDTIKKILSDVQHLYARVVGDHGEVYLFFAPRRHGGEGIAPDLDQIPDTFGGHIYPLIAYQDKRLTFFYGTVVANVRS